MLIKEQSLLNNLSCIHVSMLRFHLASTIPTSVIIPRENNGKLLLHNIVM